jgi:hypothetical protein
MEHIKMVGTGNAEEEHNAAFFRANEETIVSSDYYSGM